MVIIARVIMTIIGCILLLPGLCGVLTFGVSFFNFLLARLNSYFAVEALSFNVIGIQIGCLGLWFIAVLSKNFWLRNFTRYAGWFGAFSMLFFALRVALYALFALYHHTPLWKNGIIPTILLPTIAFLIGGLPAVCLQPTPENGRRPNNGNEHP